MRGMFYYLTVMGEDDGWVEGWDLGEWIVGFGKVDKKENVLGMEECGSEEEEEGE